VRQQLAEEFALTQADLDEELPSGRAKTFPNRVGWATTYLFRCGLIDRRRRSVYAITARGQEVLKNYPSRVDLGVLSQFPEFHEFRRAQTDVTKTAPVRVAQPDDAATPEERMSIAHVELRAALAAELLDRIVAKPPDFFEQLVLDVLAAMGYGGRRDDAAERLGQSGDEGVDGVIREDRLGLDQIYIQAKRWAFDRTVGRPEIQRFVGALHGQRASKGVFITTSSFSAEAAAYADGVTPRVILIGGRELAQLMIDYDVAVTLVSSWDIKRVDSDYFDADEGAE
jgi:restriction system protein